MFEPARAPLIDAATFLRVWDEYGAPILQLRPTGDPLSRNPQDHKLIDGVYDAVRHVARCLYGLGGSLLRNSIEATEWLLLHHNDPTHGSTDGLADRFAVRAAAIMTSVAGNATENLALAQSVYNSRNHHVHRPAAWRKGLKDREIENALELFLLVLRYVVQWMESNGGNKAGKAALQRHLQQLADELFPPESHQKSRSVERP